MANGLSEDLTIRLATWRGFPVISRSSTYDTDGVSMGIEGARKQLGARYAIVGSVRHRSSALRVSVQLIDTATSQQVWADQYDGDVSESFAFEDRITEAIVAAMYPELLEFEAERAVHRPGDLDAWSLAHRGWWHFSRDTAEDNAEARTLFTSATELAPSWSWAFAGLALAHYQGLSRGYVEDPERSRDELVRAAERSVALDDTDPFSHHAMGHAYAVFEMQGKMISAFEMGVELNPSDSLARNCFGQHLAFMGRPDPAVEQLETAIRLSPRDPWMARFRLGLARGHFAASRYPQAAEWAERSIQWKPSAPAYRLLAASSAHMGAMEQAERALEELARLEPSLSLIDLQAFYAVADPDFTARLIEGLRRVGLKEPIGPEKPFPPLGLPM